MNLKLGLQLTVTFIINQLLTLLQHIGKGRKISITTSRSPRWHLQIACFARVTKPEYIQFAIIKDEGNQKIFTFEKVKSKNLGFFFF